MLNWRLARRSAVVAMCAAVAAALGFAPPAAAHVTVTATEAVQGGFTRLAFRVPTESDSASTTKVEVFLPENAPVASVSTMPVPGWTVALQRRTLAQPIEVHGAQVSEVVSAITWTATGDVAIKPGQFQEFPVSMGPLPTVDQMVFKALQTYSDGTVVRWIEEPAAGGAEPESPAPVLKLRPAAGPTPSAGANAADASGESEEDSDALPIALSIVALVAGAGGLVLGGLAFARSQRPANGKGAPSPRT